MNRDNLVIFKGSIDGINVVLDKDADFSELIQVLEEKLNHSKKFFEGASTSLRFQGRALTKEQQEILMKTLIKQEILDISFVYEFEQTDCAKQDDYTSWLKNELLEPNVALSYIHTGLVRSGQQVHYNGTVIVLGDVNPGGVVTASFNIIILGALKGKAHAGMDSMCKNPFVVALDMQPSHIQIKGSIAQSPKKEEGLGHKKYSPQIAYQKEDRIYVDEIDFKTLNHMLQ